MLPRSQKCKSYKNPTQYERVGTLIVNKYLPWVRYYNIKNYDESGWSFSKVAKRRKVVLIKVGFKRQRMPKTKPIGESIDFYTSVNIIKCRLKTKVRISRHNEKENCRVGWDQHRYIRIIENGIRMWELQIIKVYKKISHAPVGNVRLAFDTLILQDTDDVGPWEEDMCQYRGGPHALHDAYLENFL